ncbi:MAG TPA: DUF2207 domain-containing protein, partial [Methanosarcina vacuolata]|nr:DUF2207 domain-containing protein [Methanosarcina vacuolata]
MELSDASFEAAIEANLNSALLTTILSKATLLKTILLLLLAFCLVSSASAKYSLERAETNIIVNASGITNVKESISYAFDGDYIDIHRELKALPAESIRNVSELGYKLWGEEWEKPLKSFKGNIMLPVKKESEIRYWTHPVAYTQEVNIENSAINLRAGEIPSTQWYEVRAVFPGITSSGFGFVKVDEARGFGRIVEIENAYQQKNMILNSLYRKTFLFALFVLAFPLLIYYIYGREQKIDYEKISETEVPDNSKP